MLGISRLFWKPARVNVLANGLMSSSEELKKKGNDAFAAGNFQEAIEHFSSAIVLDPSNAVLYSNRSAAEASMSLWESALEDAERAIELRRDWSKGHSRRGTALMGLMQYEAAVRAFEEGHRLEPGNAAIKQSLESARRKVSGGDAGTSFNNPFADPSLIAKLAGNPKTVGFLGQPDFIMKLGEIQKDPKKLAEHMQDARIMTALATMLQADLPDSGSGDDGDDSEVPAPVEKEEQRMSGEKEESLREKELGNAAYKQKDFQAALEHYEKAINLDPTNASFLANKSAVLFEMGSLAECMEVCEEAVRVGREHHAEFKLIGRVLGRIGSCQERLGDLDAAIKYYGKSLTEARNPEIAEKLRAAEKARVAAEKAKLYNPELAEEERNLGNDAFRKQDYVTAVKHYTEAIRRDEKDPRAYSNRSACYLKLAAIAEGMKDAERCLELDPAFAKGYLRKAALLFAKRQYSEAVACLEAGMERDAEGKHRAEFQQQMNRCYAELTRASTTNTSDNGSEEERMKRAMSNPEVQEILGDPAMRVILQQMESDPKALMEHMKNPQVAAKIRKLAQHGVIRTK